MRKLKQLLTPGGKFVFAVDTVMDRCADDSDYKLSITVKTKEGFDLILKNKNYYDEQSQTQFSPGIYELYNGKNLLQSEHMNFQTHLYKFNEMEQYLKEVGFTTITSYSTFQKEVAIDNRSDMFLFECSFQ